MPTAYSSKKYLPDYFRVRWVFEYQDGSICAGMWNLPGVCKHTKASLQNRKGLKNVYIQGKHRVSKEVKTFAKRSAENFLEIRNISLNGVPGTNQMRKFGEIKLSPNIHGMMLVTTLEKIECLISGVVVTRPNNEKKIIGAR